MAAELTKFIVIVFSLLIISQACAAEKSRLLEERTLELSLQKFELAKSNLERKVDECEKKKITVPPSVFKSVNLTKMELKIALFVLHNRAEDACDEVLRGKFVIAASIYRTTATHYQKKATSALPYSEDMLFGHYWQRVESEAQYLVISNRQREILESIPQLQKPFHLFQTLSKLDDI